MADIDGFGGKAGHNMDVAGEQIPSSAVSARESQVLAALGEHLSNAEISARMFISVRTVESHVSSLLRKLGAIRPPRDGRK